MKRVRCLKKYAFFFLSIGLLFSCKKENIADFDKETAYIYFDIPYQKNAYGENLSYRLDSIACSFALADETVADTVIPVVVKIMGVPFNQDREYSVELIEETTTATAAEWDKGILEKRVIKAGEITDTIKIKVQRTKVLTEKWMQIGMRLVANDYFAAGYDNLQTVKVSFSDILSQPDWWQAWEPQFGKFYREVYQKWIELYQLGVDPNKHPNNGEPLYWNNMPPSWVPGWYPVLDVYLNELKRYFRENTIYPDGDETKNPIKLPA